MELTSLESPLHTIIFILIVFVFMVSFLRPDKLRHIPTIGPSGRFTSYIGALRYIRHSRETVSEGYKKYKGGVFKIAELGYGWHVMVTSKRHIEELRTREDVLSNDDANKFIVQGGYTMPGMFEHPIHIPIVKARLMRNFDLDAIFPEMYDEISAGFEDLVPPSDEWKAISAVDTVQSILCRASNRVFIGLPLCRNQEYIRINIDRARNIFFASVTLKFVPAFLKPFVVRFFRKLSQGVTRGTSILSPLIEERRRKTQTKNPNDELKPNDFLQWMMERVEGPDGTTESLVHRILLLNFASIHSSSSAFTHAIYDLAANPECIQVLRDEAEEVIQREGWTQAAMQKLQRIDSFLKESQRMHSQITVSMMRIVSKDFTFFDGTFLPKGSIVSVASDPIQNDEEFYSDPEVFNPWRFSDLNENTERPINVSTTSTEFLIFGHGRRACPGRFFATTELKAMLAHLVLNYDVKFANEGVRPLDNWINGINFPNHKIEVMFRKRQS